ncbi:MAG TPA: Sm ribonucleo [Pyrodictiaceae archaeon]|nr:Sm ribonucleo [Pyrodictiaceae archaeon]HIQ11170.1 Sm ribonucleo [Pyrodictium sp.]HIQ55634.1 Sm ribonucleo [Pyrodictium sp.]
MLVSTPKRVSPLRVLREAVNHTVLVKLKDGSEYVGKLEMTDGTMNLVLSDCMELNEDGSPKVKYGRVLIRGSHILFVSVDYEMIMHG